VLILVGLVVGFGFDVAVGSFVGVDVSIG
jgi:hypothetical protein